MGGSDLSPGVSSPAAQGNRPAGSWSQVQGQDSIPRTQFTSRSPELSAQLLSLQAPCNNIGLQRLNDWFHLLLCSPNACSSQRWAKPRPGILSGSPTWRGKDPRTWAFTYCFLRYSTGRWLASGVPTQPQAPLTGLGCGPSPQHLNFCPCNCPTISRGVVNLVKCPSRLCVCPQGHGCSPPGPQPPAVPGAVRALCALLSIQERATPARIRSRGCQS